MTTPKIEESAALREAVELLSEWIGDTLPDSGHSELCDATHVFLAEHAEEAALVEHAALAAAAPRDGLSDAFRVRQAFEAWAFDHGWRNFTRDEHSGAYVVEGGLEHRWIGWNACALATSAQEPTDSQRCINARNALWATLDGPGAVTGSLEEAVATACRLLATRLPPSAAPQQGAEE